MGKETISITIDEDILKKADERREGFEIKISRSAYITSLILKDLESGGAFVVKEKFESTPQQTGPTKPVSYTSKKKSAHG